MYDMKKTVKIVLYDTVADPVQIKIFPYIPSTTVVKIVDNPMTKVRISSIDKKSYIEKAPSGIIIGWSENNAGIGVYRDRYFYDLVDDGTRIIDLADQILAVAVRKLYEGGSAQGFDFDKLDIMTLA